MAAKSAAIDLISQPKESPHCAHGPTLLFERYDKASGCTRQFFACSAFRDRKACPFFQWARPEKHKGQTVEGSWSLNKGMTHREARKRYRQLKNLPQCERHVCCTCGEILSQSELQWHQGKGHEVKLKVSKDELRRPTHLFVPRDNSKTFAQYLFTMDCVEFIVSSLEKLGFTHVLCVGAPRIHEAIQTLKTDRLKSMLLDLDDRYAFLYPPTKYAKYNMFNHHFFEATGKLRAVEFLSEGQTGVVLVTDPPFGGMVEALALSFHQISKLWQGLLKTNISSPPLDKSGFKIPTLWFFPYFNESRIISQLPGMTMLDYKVGYENHSMFKNSGSPKGSLVRIFTNIAPSQFYLPLSEGYWYCEECQRYSSKENVHCKECGGCTSKDGTTYRHCDMCMRCVKPSRVHCFKCEQCQLPNHVCGGTKTKGCHICGDPGHKRLQCPQKSMQGENLQGQRVSSLKRKREESSIGSKKKKKKMKKI